MLVRSGRERRYCRRDRIQAALFDVRALGALERSATGALEWSRGRGSVLAAASPARFRRPGCSVPGVLRRDLLRGRQRRHRC
ncbi:MAG: hypothetical protein M3550_02660, partial [Actinomycetota bacterium]|nr:hypothetical protein [Actinomycetota bacterium]